MYTEQELVGVAKRENNTKRNYLVVNRLQGKHVPVSPGDAAAMFGELAELVKKQYKQERLLLVGFAETATAIGASVAAELDCYYIQTTREVIEGVDYLYFSEAHSHATEQKLVKDDIDQVIGEVDRIIFIEDEVTTGNTICNIIDILEKEYGGQAAFAVASLLNGMDRDAEKRYGERGIDLHYLVKTDHSGYGAAADSWKGDGSYIGLLRKEGGSPHTTYSFTGAVNARRVTKGTDYRDSCGSLWKKIREQFEMESGGGVLVLGTEEFMYPALYAALKMEQSGCDVKFHATTRSPIAVSSEGGYPLHVRYELKSLYDEERVTYVYDLAEYDSVFIITDAACEYGSGLSYLTAALESCGSRNIKVIRWCK